MNNINITPEQFWSVNEGRNAYLPAIVNDKKYVLKFEVEQDMTASQIKKFFQELRFAINVDSDIDRHIGRNIGTVKFIGAATTDEFLANLSEASEIDRSLF